MTKLREYTVKFLLLPKGKKLKDLTPEEREDTIVYTRKVNSKRSKRKAYKHIVQKVKGMIAYKHFSEPVEVTILDIKETTWK